MSLGNRSPRLLNHLKELPLIPGQDQGSLGSLHRLKKISQSLRYEALYCNSEILFHTFLALEPRNISILFVGLYCYLLICIV